MSYRLKLVDGYEAMFIGTLQIVENLVESKGRRRDVAYFHVPTGIALTVERNACAQRGNYLKEAVEGCLSPRFQTAYDAASHLENHVLQVLRGIDVDEERVVVVVQLWLCETMVKQPCFSHASWRNQGRMVAVGK